MEILLKEKITKSVVEIYVTEYTSATMAESYSQALREQKEANDWCKEKISQFNLDREQVKKELERCTVKAKRDGTACCYDLDILKDM